MSSRDEPTMSGDEGNPESADAAGRKPDAASERDDATERIEVSQDVDATERIDSSALAAGRSTASDDAAAASDPDQPGGPGRDDDATQQLSTVHPWEAEDDADRSDSAVSATGSAAAGSAARPARRGSGDGSGSDALPQEKSRNPWLGIVVRTLIVAAVLGGAYVALAQYFGGRIPGGTTVEGIDIGGMTPDGAAERLEARLAPLRDDPVILIADDERYEIAPADAGLRIDIDATIDGLTGVNYDPRALWRQISGSDYSLDVITTSDVAAVREQVGTFADEVSVEPVEGSVELVQGAVQQEASQTGLDLDVNQTSELVVRGWPDTREVEAVVTDVEPALTNEEIDRFVAEEAEPALASAIVVRVEDLDAVISENQLARLLTVVEEDNALSLELDEETMLEIVRDATGELVGEATDAGVRLGSNGRPEIIPAETGAELDEEAVVEGVRGVLTNPDPDERTIEVEAITVEPEFTTADAEDWNFEEMSDFSSVFPTTPGNEGRTENLRVGMGKVNGTVVMPGDSFSLSDVLSPVDADNGYVPAGVISNGRLTQGMGGGLSQVSTTVLNGAWDAGVQLDEFQPHSYFISRYPEGKEATLAIGVIDNRWTNDTETPIVVRAWVDDGESALRIQFWGDPQYQVETETSARSNIVQPGSDTSSDPGCMPQAPEIGFDVSVTRVLSSGGDEVDREVYNTRYQPADGITCTG